MIKFNLQNKNNRMFIQMYWVVPEVIADFFIQIKHIFSNTRNKL